EAVSTSETNNLGIFSFPAIKDAGVYHACMVTRVGWTQQTQNWSGTPYHIATNNLSGNTSEGPYCRTIDYSDTANYSNKFYFGNVDTQVPVGNAVYHGGIVIDNIIYIESIDDLSFTETIHDNHGVIRATYLVQKLNADSGNYEGFCGNWNKHSLGSHSLGGLTAEVHTINNIRNCASDTSTWTDGTYKIFHAGYDSTGNEGKFNTNRQIFTIDSTAPDAPVLGLKIDDNPVASGFITNKSSVKAIWNKPSLDTVKYEYEYWNDIVGNPYKELSPWRTVVLSENRQGDFTEGEGKHFIRVRAIDHIGNKSSWSNVFEITYDKTAPKVTINALPTSTLGNPTVSGTATEVSSIQLTIGDSLEVDIAVEDGVWTYTIPEEDSLTNGSYGVFANATDQAGNVAEPAMATLVIAIPDDTNEDSIDDSQIAPQEQSSSGVLGSSIGSSGSDSRTATQSPATNRTSRMHTTTPPTGYDANEVLAESDEVDSSELNRGAVQSELDEAKTLASSNTSEETDGCKTILGICWYYWIPVVIVAIVTTYYISRDSKNKD
ncbi:hypothetical protein KC867_03015, partial [Candidatus Saccharibacteria bacterium]|nr:hypothetical protein [Candidatus Saccharibacteria bacterium]